MSEETFEQDTNDLLKRLSVKAEQESKRGNDIERRHFGCDLDEVIYMLLKVF